MNCIIIDNDIRSRNYLKRLLEKINKIAVVGEYESGLEGLKSLKKKPVDLLFLDVELPELNGLDFMATIAEDIQVIVVSDKTRYAAEAFDYNVTDYIVKPVLETRLVKALERVEVIYTNVLKKSESENNFFIKTQDEFIRLNFRDILFIEALADYVKIHTPTAKHVMLSTMKAIEDRLVKNGFLRIHRSYIVSKNAIENINGNFVKINGHELPISRTYRQFLMSELGLK